MLLLVRRSIGWLPHKCATQECLTGVTEAGNQIIKTKLKHLAFTQNYKLQSINPKL